MTELRRKDNLIISDIALRNAKPKDKPYRIKDAKGFYLLVNPDGSKWWRLDYSLKEKRNTLSIGVYPDVTLAQARKDYQALREQIKNGTDPALTRKQARSEKAEAREQAKLKAQGIPLKNSFEEITLAWLDSIKHTVTPTTHLKKTRRFELRVFPVIGDQAISQVSSPDVFNVLKPIIARNELETAHRVHAEIASVFAYAVAHGFTTYDPAQPVAKQIPPQKVKHRAALTEPKEVGQLLRDIYNYQRTFVTQCAFRLSPLLFQRPGEIRQMEWQDVHLGI